MIIILTVVGTNICVMINSVRPPQDSFVAAKKCFEKYINIDFAKLSEKSKNRREAANFFGANSSEMYPKPPK